MTDTIAPASVPARPVSAPSAIRINVPMERKTKLAGCCARDRGRFAMNCIQLAASAGRLYATATDGRILAQLDLGEAPEDWVAPWDGGPSVLIPREEWAEAFEKGGASEKRALLVRHGGSYRLTRGPLEIDKPSGFDGNFPRWDALFERKPESAPEETGLSPALGIRVLQFLQSVTDGGVRFRQRGAGSPIHLEPVSERVRARAVVMPVTLG